MLIIMVNILVNTIVYSQWMFMGFVDQLKPGTPGSLAPWHPWDPGQPLNNFARPSLSLMGSTWSSVASSKALTSSLRPVDPAARGAGAGIHGIFATRLTTMRIEWISNGNLVGIKWDMAVYRMVPPNVTLSSVEFLLIMRVSPTQTQPKF